jgi:hypothetical protein
MRCSLLSGKQTLFSKQRNKTYATGSFEIQEPCESKRPKLYPFCLKAPKQQIRQNSRQNSQVLQAKKIAEAIILQAIEDLWSPIHKQESIEFFTGEGYALCAQILDMGLIEKLKIIQIIKKAQKKEAIQVQRNF